MAAREFREGFWRAVFLFGLAGCAVGVILLSVTARWNYVPGVASLAFALLATMCAGILWGRDRRERQERQRRLREQGWGA